jgi:hypothetical protein
VPTDDEDGTSEVLGMPEEDQANRDDDQGGFWFSVQIENKSSQSQLRMWVKYVHIVP